MTTTEYKRIYGEDSLSSAEYKEEKRLVVTGKNNPMYGRTHSDKTKERISSLNKGKEAYNKGIPMSDGQKEILRELAIQRNLEWHKESAHPLVGRTVSESTKEKIKEKRKHQVITKEQCYKAYNTKLQNGWVSPMKGKTHSQEIKDKIFKSTENSRKIRKEQSAKRTLDAISSLNFTLLNSITDHFLHIKCNTCGFDFTRTHQCFDPSKIRNDMCDNCFPKLYTKSNAEIEILNYIRTLIPDECVESGNRKVIYPLELDIYIPSKNIAIEYCGLYWHSDNMKNDKQYHVRKLKLCNDAGIRLITIFEDEYVEKREIVLNRIKNLLGGIPTKIGARTCEVRQISSGSANTFLRRNHIQSSGRSNVRYGLFYNDKLISVMTFSKENLSRKITDWELNRFATEIDIIVQGGASKLLKAFITDYAPEKIITYADRRWSEGNLYEQIGFGDKQITPPNYWYVKGSQRYHRFSLRKNETDDPLLTEWENRKKQGWQKIWDCGSIRYTYIKID